MNQSEEIAPDAFLQNNRCILFICYAPFSKYLTYKCDTQQLEMFSLCYGGKRLMDFVLETGNFIIN